MTHDLFISYSTENSGEAVALCESIESSGVRCWIAPRNIPAGSTWPAAIASAIAESRMFVLLFSRSSAASKEVARELERAMSRKLQVLPIRLEPLAPQAEFEYYLSNTQWLDAFDGVQVNGAAIVRRVTEMAQACAASSGITPKLPHARMTREFVHPDDWGKKRAGVSRWRRMVDSIFEDR